MQHERIVPGYVEVEQALLGKLLGNQSAMSKVMDVLGEDDFCIDAHQHVYRAMQSLYRHGKRVNVFNVRVELQRVDALRHVGQHPDERSGEAFLDDLAYSLDTLNSTEDLLHTVKHASLARHLLSAAKEMAEMAYRQDEDMLERAEKLIYSLSLNATHSTVFDMNAVMDEFEADLEQRRQNFVEKVANGVPTNFHDLDQILGGLQPGEMYILAARPAVGKTALSLNITSNIVQHARHVLFFSREMKKRALAQRLIAMDTPMDQSLLRSGDIVDEEMEKIRDVIANYRAVDLKIDDGSVSISEIRSTARAVHAAKPLDLIVVDYLQLVRPSVNKGKQGNREQEVAEVSRELKLLAMEMNIPLLVLSQLSRDVEKRADKRPQLSDLRESGSVEQDSDNVLFLHVTEENLEKKAANVQYEVQIVVAKQRNGRVGEIDLVFKPRSTKFVDATLENVYGDKDAK